MRKIVAVLGVSFSFFAAPLLVSAQSSCPQITQTLARGSSGTQVIALQQYFIRLGYLDEESASGYFGALTEGAVQRFQRERNIVSSGTPATTGYGAVGPTTRGVLRNCGEAAPLTIADLPAQQAGNLVNITNKANFYTHLYQCVLGRTPSSAEISTWSSFSVTSHLQVFNGFLASNEYIAKNANNAAYVDKLYQCVLFRNTEIPGNTYWLNELSRGVTRAAVLNNVLASSEYSSTVAPRVTSVIGVSSVGATATAALSTQQTTSCSDGMSWVNGQCVTTPVNTLQATCSFNGSTVTSGAAVTAYQASSVANGQTCVSESRTCTNGQLSGSYTYSTCSVQNTSAATSYWVKPDNASKVCKYFANTDRYDVIGTKDFKHCINEAASNQVCITTPFYWMPSTDWAIPENRPDYLPADGIIQQVRCSATGAARATVAAPEFTVTSPEKYQILTPGGTVYVYWSAKNIPVSPAAVTLESGSTIHSLGRSTNSSAAYMSIPSTFPTGGATLKITVPKDPRFDVETAVHSIPVVVNKGTAAGSCRTPWDAPIASGAKVTAYLTAYVPAGGTCLSEERTCTSGTLSGSYYYKDCSTGEISGGLQARNTTFSSPAGGETYVKGGDPIPVRFSGGFGAIQFENVDTGAIYSGSGQFAGTDNKMDVPFDAPPGRYRLILRTTLYDGSSNIFTVSSALEKPILVSQGSEVNACKYLAGVERYDQLGTRNVTCDGNRASCADPSYARMWSATSGAFYWTRSQNASQDVVNQIRCSSSGALPYIKVPRVLITAPAGGESYARLTDKALIRFTLQDATNSSMIVYFENTATGKQYQEPFDSNAKPGVDNMLSVPWEAPAGTYRVFIRDGSSGALSAKSEIINITNAIDKPIWVKPGSEAAVCRTVADVTTYVVVQTRDARCTSSTGRCVNPPFYWSISPTAYGYLYKEDRPSSLPADGIVKQIKCTSTGTSASASSPVDTVAVASQLASILAALEALLQQLRN